MIRLLPGAIGATRSDAAGKARPSASAHPAANPPEPQRHRPISAATVWVPPGENLLAARSPASIY